MFHVSQVTSFSVFKIFFFLFSFSHHVDCGKKNHCYGSVISVASKFEEKETVIKGHFNGCVADKAEKYEDQHGGNCFPARNRRVYRILEFCAAMNMSVWKKRFKKTKITRSYVSLKGNQDYFLIGQDQIKFVKNIRLLSLLSMNMFMVIGKFWKELC